MHTSRTLTLAVTTMAAGALSIALSAPANAHDRGNDDDRRGDDRRYNARLSGAVEVPTKGDPDGRGTAGFRVQNNQVCYTLRVRGIEKAAAAHIHEARKGKAGPVVVTLKTPASGRSSGCVKVERALARDIKNNPAKYYANVHNASYPGGALRGQLSR